ncbi:MAG: hypothetical protein F2947_02150 [Actinobacteria bacterium]|uniref:Unannotated protein n=1 Tax=freshwater metagenome TaxID=449393 RepID=A0A6J7VG97_9ZZZZ|nr:hypothetical protein [Actinomycetota bacterium]MTA42189.1 hypothetical protein [Actinomycetota bacterium]MTA44098.1 hypothetical protein [Actinomycetota bacterium]
MKSRLGIKLCIILLTLSGSFSGLFASTRSNASAIPAACAASDSSHFTVITNADAGAGSLRQAMADAQNANGGTVCVLPNLSTILLSSHITYEGTGTLLLIGNGVIVKGGNNESAGGGIFSFQGVRGDEFDTVLPLQIDGFKFLQGVAHDGGAINTQIADVVVKNSIFDQNQAVTRSVGGAIASFGGNGPNYESIGSLTVSDSSFTNNTDVCSDCGSDGGGAIDVQGIPLTVIRSSFVGNTSTGPGGAIDVTNSDLTVLASTFVANVSSSGNNNRGGAIYATGAATISFSTFSGNQAQVGSAISALGSSTLWANVFVKPGSTALCQNSATSSSYNYANETANSCGLLGTADSSLDSNDPGLGTLSTGPGVQQWRSPGAAIIGIIPNAGCVDPNISSPLSNSTDEVNAPRPPANSGSCTPGAVEPVAQQPPTTTTAAPTELLVPAFTG